jgi:uncharacterized protein
MRDWAEEEAMGHPVVHFEIGGPDDGQLAAFYAGLFGWQLRTVPDASYTLVSTGGGINGGVRSGEPYVTFYVETDDLQSILDKVNILGGKTITPITELPGMATYALLSDPGGMEVGLVLAADRQAAEGAGVPVDWFEILSPDADRSRRFCAEVFGWQLNVAEYTMVNTGAGIGGGIGAAQDTGWVTVYASVEDVESILTRAAGLGGSREYGPLAVDDHMQTGAFRDPAGNVFGVYHHPPH